MRVFCKWLLELGHLVIIAALPQIRQRHGGHVGKCRDELLLLKTPFHVAIKHDVTYKKEYAIRLAVVSHSPPSPAGVGNVVETETRSPK